MPKSVGSFDIEHSTNPMRPWMDGFYMSLVSFQSEKKDEVWAFDHDEIERYDFNQNIKEIQLAIDSVDMVCAHNLKHDMTILRYHGVDFEKVQLWCTMVADYIIYGQDAEMRWSLDETAKRHGVPGKLDKVKTYWDRGYDTHEVPLHILDEYVRDDAKKCILIQRHQEALIKDQGQVQLVKLHNDYVRSLSDMELNGFAFNTGLAGDYHAEYMDVFQTIQSDLRGVAGDQRLNFGSTNQLAAFLYGGTTTVSWTDWVTKEFKKYPNETKYYEKEFKEEITLSGVGFTVPKRARTKGGKPKTDKGTLDRLKCNTKLQNKVKTQLLAMSEVKKVAETLIGKRTETGLVSKVQSDGCIHVKLNQTVTKTGRGSSSDPNGQNFPRSKTSPIKTCIIPTWDYIAQYDLKQIEWKLAAELSGDRIMIDEINAGIDQHDATGADLFGGEGDRVDWKVFNFRMIYGGSYYGFYMDHKMPDFAMNVWQNIVQDFCVKYSGLTAWQQRNIAATLRGEPMVLFTGRRFHFYKTLWKDGIWQYNERQVKNYPVQGLAGGDILPLVASMIRKGLMKYDLKSKLILTVHDSIVFDAKKLEIKLLAKLCHSVGNQLSQSIESYFGYRTSVTNFGGDFEIGETYGGLERIEP
jgi:DNA polymerase-1